MMSENETRLRQAVTSLLSAMEEGYVKEKHIKRDLREALDGYGCRDYDVVDSRLLTSVNACKDIKIESRNGEWFYNKDGVDIGPFNNIRDAMATFSELEKYSQ